jgi:hypothetical protein
MSAQLPKLVYTPKTTEIEWAISPAYSASTSHDVFEAPEKCPWCHQRYSLILKSLSAGWRIRYHCGASYYMATRQFPWIKKMPKRHVKRTARCKTIPSNTAAIVSDLIAEHDLSLEDALANNKDIAAILAIHRE